MFSLSIAVLIGHNGGSEAQPRPLSEHLVAQRFTWILVQFAPVIPEKRTGRLCQATGVGHHDEKLPGVLSNVAVPSLTGLSEPREM